jgi:tripartite-type tricarboxylate transporter receptor subunit TctC
MPGAGAVHHITSRYRGVFQKHGNLGSFGAFGGYAMKLPRRQFLRLAAGAAALPALPRIARAQAYPTRPVRILVGFPAGISPDIVARLIGQPLSARLGQPFVIENRPGAGSNIATEAVIRAPPDGYTLLIVSPTNTINATLYPNLAFDFVRDIVPVASIDRSPFVMAVNPSVPAKTVSEFIAYAKANPGKLNIGSAGIGTPPHVCGELLKMLTGVDLVHVPYRGSYIPDLLGGHVQVSFGPIATLIEYIRTGKLRALAVTTAMRSNALPDIPTVGEFVPGYEASGWLGIGAPKGTSTEIIERLNKEINAVIAAPDVKARLVGLGVEPMSMTPAEFGKFIADDTEKWAKVIRFANIKVE